MTRKSFFGSLTAISAAASVGQWANIGRALEPRAVTAPDAPATDDASRFAGRVFDDSARVLCGALSYIGDQLGFFKTMAQLDTCTPAQWATASRCNERLIAEWLKAMVAYEYVEYGSSVLGCLHDSMAKDGAALGPLPETRITQLAKHAGFTKFRRLPIKSAYDALYEAKR